MQNTIATEVQEVLTTTPEQITFEQIHGEDSSPLNQPVIEKDIGGIAQTIQKDNAAWNVWKPNPDNKSIEELQEEQQNKINFRSTTEAEIAAEKAQEPLDAPEQDISATSDTNQQGNEIVNDNPQIPLAQANQAADAVLGMSNNLLEVGGGYFVKLRKHEDFFEFEEIIALIDEQNEKNVQRIKLDNEDQALLKPLLAQVLQKKSKKLTPEQQLLGAVISILMKKAQLIYEVRAENTVLESRMIQIIRDEKKKSFFETSEPEKEEVALETDDTTNDSEDATSSVLEVAKPIKEAS